MGTIPCPGCRTNLEPSDTVCPICLRPRGKLEITRAYATLRHVEKARQRRPFVIAGYLLVVGAASWLGYRARAPIAAACVSARGRARRFIHESLASAVPNARPAAAPPSLSAAPRPLPAPAVPSLVSPAKTGRRPARVDDLPLPACDPVSQWVLHGRVYDLITLLPVPDAQLSFMTAGSLSQSARSDANGRFAAVLGRLKEGGYELRASLAGYAVLTLHEPDIPYARLSLAERREIALGAQGGDMAQSPLTDIIGETSIRRDVFLAPNR